jgi:hypothetical protein
MRVHDLVGGLMILSGAALLGTTVAAQSSQSLSAGTATDAAMGSRRFLVVTELSDPSRVVLQQASPQPVISTRRRPFDEA